MLRVKFIQVAGMFCALCCTFNSIGQDYESIENGQKYKITFKTGGNDNQIEGFWGKQKISLFVEFIGFYKAI